MDRFTTLLTEALGPSDFVALIFFIVAIIGATILIERRHAQRLSTSRLMAIRRAAWMREMSERDVRIQDAQLLAIQHRGAGFFASACMIAVGGCVALLGATDELRAIAIDLTADAAESQRAVWELKILFILVLLVLAMMKFVWAHRLFGYCAVIIGSTPPPGGADCPRIANEAAEININAGRSFNRGLRLVYFTFAGLAWMLGAFALALATFLVIAMLVRREYFSATHRLLSSKSTPPLSAGEPSPSSKGGSAPSA